MDASGPPTFTPVQFDPNAISNNRQRGIPVQPSGSSHYTPYSRSTPSSKPSTSLASASIIDDDESARCTTDLPEAPQSKSYFKDYNKTQQTAIDWAQKRLIMDGVTSGWIRNSTKAEKAKMEARVIEIIFQASVKHTCELEANDYVKDRVVQALTRDRRRLAKSGEEFVHLHNLEPPSKLPKKEREIYMNKRRETIYDANQPYEYYLHDVVETDVSSDVVVFVGKAAVQTHLTHWYASKKSPLCDEEMRASITTTPLDMFAATAAATRCVIDRYVEGRLSGSNNTLRFATEVYAEEQQLIMNAIKLALAQDSIHREPLTKHLLDLHNKGLRILHKMLGIAGPSIPIYIPMRAEELSRPRLVPHRHITATLPGPSNLLSLVETGGQAPLTMDPQMTFEEMKDSDDMGFWGFPNFDFEQPRLELELEGSGSNLNEMPFSMPCN